MFGVYCEGMDALLADTLQQALGSADEADVLMPGFVVDDPYM